MLHNRYMRGTRLDIITGLGLVAMLAFVIVMLVGPVRTLAKERDLVRTDHVRTIMTAVLQTELQKPKVYDELVAELKSQNGQKMLIGQGNCGGSHGAQCSDAETSNNCLEPTIFPTEFLPAIPVDPRSNVYSVVATGYYLSLNEGRIEVGACAAAGEPIVLRKN